MYWESNKCLERKVKVKVTLLSHVQLFATPWTVAYWAPLSMGFSRQEYWSGLPSMGSHKVRHDLSDLAVAVAVAV